MGGNGSSDATQSGVSEMQGTDHVDLGRQDACCQTLIPVPGSSSPPPPTWLQESGPSISTLRTPSSLAFSKMKRLPARAQSSDGGVELGEVDGSPEVGTPSYYISGKAPGQQGGAAAGPTARECCAHPSRCQVEKAANLLVPNFPNPTRQPASSPSHCTHPSTQR